MDINLGEATSGLIDAAVTADGAGCARSVVDRFDLFGFLRSAAVLLRSVIAAVPSPGDLDGRDHRPRRIRGHQGSAGLTYLFPFRGSASVPTDEVKELLNPWDGALVELRVAALAAGNPKKASVFDLHRTGPEATGHPHLAFLKAVRAAFAAFKIAELGRSRTLAQCPDSIERVAVLAELSDQRPTRCP